MLIIDAVLLLVIVYCAYTDTTTGKIYNKITFPAMLAGIVLNAVFGGITGCCGLWSAGLSAWQFNGCRSCWLR
jgi:Flp pilus assembly protein protease CpaA